MKDVAKDWPYWMRTEHVFRPARWGRKYCDQCGQKESGEAVTHLKVEDLTEADPRHYLRDGTPTGRLDQTFFHVEGWDGDELGGASCSYAGRYTLEEALEEARKYAAQGDDRGTKYDHYLVMERHHFSVVNTLVHPVEINPEEGEQDG